MQKKKTFLYPRISCPYCKFFTTSAEKLGPHMVDEHPAHVLKGYHKVKKTSKKSNKPKKIKRPRKNSKR